MHTQKDLLDEKTKAFNAETSELEKQIEEYKRRIKMLESDLENAEDKNDEYST